MHVLNFVCVSQVNLDGFALPIKKLKGTDPVESLAKIDGVVTAHGLELLLQFSHCRYLRFVLES